MRLIFEYLQTIDEIAVLLLHHMIRGMYKLELFVYFGHKVRYLFGLDITYDFDVKFHTNKSFIEVSDHFLDIKIQNLSKRKTTVFAY